MKPRDGDLAVGLHPFDVLIVLTIGDVPMASERMRYSGSTSRWWQALKGPIAEVIGCARRKGV